MDREEHYRLVELVLSAQGALYHQDVQRANKLLDEAYWALVRESTAIEADSLADAFGDEATPQEVRDIARLASNSHRFPTTSWLKSIGFDVAPDGKSATVVIDDYDGTSADARVVLELTPYDDSEWIPTVISYDEDGEKEGTVGLVGSWLKTQQELIGLCKALGITLS